VALKICTNLTTVKVNLREVSPEVTWNTCFRVGRIQYLVISDNCWIGGVNHTLHTNITIISWKNILRAGWYVWWQYGAGDI
jgi:predicted secreted Zn-dependent protease